MLVRMCRKWKPCIPLIYGNVNSYNLNGEIVQRLLRNKIEVEYDPAILLLNISKLTIKIITNNYLYIGQEWKDNGTEKDRKMVLKW